MNSVDEGKKKPFAMHFMNLLFIYSDETSMVLFEGQRFEQDTF